MDRRGRRGLGRRDVGVGQHQGPPHRQGRGDDGHPAAGPGPRDDLLPRSSRTSWACRWRTSSSSTRTRRARRSATAPTAAAPSSVGGTAAVKAAGKVREKARRYAAHMLEAAVDDIEVDGAEYCVKGSPDKKKTIQEIAFALDLGFDTARPAWSRTSTRRRTTTRPTARGRSGRTSPIVEIDEETGDGRPRPLRRGRRRRQEDQPDDRGRAAPRRHRPGRRPGALGGGGLRRRRPAAVGLDARLRAAARVVASRASSSTRRSRPRRSTRSASRASARPARSRARRRSPTRSSTRSSPLGHPPPRHAVHRAEGLARACRPRREARHDPGGVRLHPAGLARRGARPPRRVATRRQAHRGRPEPAAAA